MSAAAKMRVDGDPRRVTIELAVAATPERLEEWLRTARSGAQTCYASGFDLPREAPGVVLAAKWQAQGLVHLKQSRDAQDRRRWHFLIERSSKPLLVHGPRHAVIPAERKAMLAELARCADRGLPCPSLGELRQRLKLRTRQQAQYQIERLAADGLIRVENRGPKLPRVVTIVKTGKETGRG